MNIMLKIDDEVITPPLNGAILAGITRDSVLTLLRDWGLRVSERPVAIDEVIAAAQAGRLEMWGTGTAAVISPVGELGYKGERYVINGGQHRRADAEAVRHDRRHPVRHCAGSARLDAAAGQPAGRMSVDITPSRVHSAHVISATRIVVIRRRRRPLTGVGRLRAR